MGSWVELRVHGVSGTPPASMLATDGPLRRIPLGARTAAYRPVDDAGEDLLGPDEQVLEAFHWGAHTSGSARQAYWLLLLPFGMANAAQFMLPTGPGAPARVLRALAGAALRVLSLALTVLFVLALAIGLLDLVVWQWLGRWAAGGLPVLLALGIGGCTAAVVWLSRLGRAGRAAGTATEDPFAATGGLDAAAPPGFSSPDFFAGDPDAPALRRLHLTAGVLVVGYLSWAVAGDFGDGGLAGTARWWTGAALGAVALTTALLGDAPGASGRAPDVSRSAWGTGAVVLSWTALGLAAASVAGAVAVLLLGGAGAGDVVPRGALPAVDGVVVVVAGTGLAALAALALFTVPLGLSTPQAGRVPAVFRRFAHGWAAPLVAGLGLLVGVGFTAAATYVAQFAIGLLPGPAVRTTPLLQRVAFAWGVLALVLVVVAGLVWTWVRRRARHHADVAVATYLAAGHPAPDAATAGRIGRAVALARVKGLLEIVLLTVAAVGGVLAAALVVEQWQGWCAGAGCPPGEVSGPLGQLSAVAEAEGWVVTAVTRLGAGVLLALAAALGWIAHTAFRGEGVRRAVNVVWDVIAFWPRAAHPFVPEPYSQDVVPGLRDRIVALLRADDEARVVVAAHSQGSLVALAALRSLPPELCPRVGVLTFGSQLRVVFPRAFPAHVGYDVVAWLAEAFGDRWVSLYRETDPIGGPVASWDRTEPPARPTSCRLGEDGRRPDDVEPATLLRRCGREWRLIDPPVDPGTGLPAGPMRGHSDYWLDPDWPRAVAVARAGTAAVRDDR